MSVERNMGDRRVGLARGEHGGGSQLYMLLNDPQSSTILTEKGGCQHRGQCLGWYNSRQLAPVVSLENAALMPRKVAHSVCAQVGLEPSYVTDSTSLAVPVSSGELSAVTR